MKNNEELDNLIKEAFKDDESYEIPKLDDVWDKIEEYIDSKNRKSTIIKRFIGVAASLLIMAIGGRCILYNEGYANYMRTMKIFVGLEDNLSINMDNTATDKIDIDVKEVAFLGKIKESVSFPIKQPQYIPKEYKYSNSYVSELNGDIISVQSIYVSGEEMLEFIQEETDKSFGEAIRINQNIGTIDKIIINGYSYNIIYYNKGEIEIIWDINEIKYRLKGKLDKEEMLKTALSIK